MMKSLPMSRRKWLQYSVLGTQYFALAGMSSVGARDTEPISDSPRVEPWTIFACDVKVTADQLIVKLTDGRTVSAPIDRYPRLLHGTQAERNNWKIGSGIGIHWPELDEDINVEGLMLGGPSQEGARSLQRWLDQRRRGLVG
jgi:hypothetical protein